MVKLEGNNLDKKYYKNRNGKEVLKPCLNVFALFLPLPAVMAFIHIHIFIQQTQLSTLQGPSMARLVASRYEPDTVSGIAV